MELEFSIICIYNNEEKLKSMLENTLDMQERY